MKTLTTFLLLCCCLSMGWAQTDSTVAGSPNTENGAATTDAQKPVVKAVPMKLIRVDRIRKFNPAYWGDTLKKQAALGTSLFPGNYVMVDIHPADMDSAIAHVSKLRLWMGGICFPDMKVIYTNPTESFVVFKLERDTAETSPWQLFYTSPNYWEFHRKVSMNLGSTTNEYKVEGQQHLLTLHTSITWRPYVFYTLFAILLLLLYRYGKGLIRDVSLYNRNGVKIAYDKTTKTDAEQGVINIHDIPYSLARLQFLLWLIVVFFGIVHIWIITNVLTSPSGSVLALLGISGGTFYIGKLIDAPKPTQPDQRTPQQIVTDFMALNTQSQNPVLDILSDGSNISLHRLQLLIFTIFLAIYFTIEVITDLVMPEFSQTMMGLMGISSLTYAGLKTTEPNTATP